MRNGKKSYGYYYVTIRSAKPGRLLQSNNERAFIISQLQDLLSPRLLLTTIPAYKQLASCIDMLAFSVRDTGIDFVLFSVDTHITEEFIEYIMLRLTQYQSEYSYLGKYRERKNNTAPAFRIQSRPLIGPHRALAKSIEIHLLHDNWEFDRYSSIGFYLHDRRGDWMRTWRIAQLYENTPEHYLEFIEQARQKPTNLQPIGLRFAA